MPLRPIVLAPRTATLVVAASDASAKSKARADYVCDGVADDVEIQAAIAALPSPGEGYKWGKVLLSEGYFKTAASIKLNDCRIIVEGQGRYSTYIWVQANVPAFEINEDNTGANGCRISNLSISGFGRTELDADGVRVVFPVGGLDLDNIWMGHVRRAINLVDQCWLLRLFHIIVDDYYDGIRNTATTGDTYIIGDHLEFTNGYHNGMELTGLMSGGHFDVVEIYSNQNLEKGLYIAQNGGGTFQCHQFVVDSVKGGAGSYPLYIVPGAGQSVGELYFTDCIFPAEVAGDLNSVYIDGSAGAVGAISFIGGRYLAMRQAFYIKAAHLVSITGGALVIGNYVPEVGSKVYPSITLENAIRCLISDIKSEAAPDNTYWDPSYLVEELGTSDKNVIINNQGRRPVKPLGVVTLIQGNDAPHEREVRPLMAKLLDLLGDVRLFLPPIEYEGTAIADYSRRGHNGLATADVKDWYGYQGRGLYYTLQAGRRISTPDHADLSFGDGLADVAFSTGIAFNLTDVTENALLNKYLDTDAEYQLYIGADDLIRLQLHDQSVPAYIGRAYTVAPSENAWHIFIATYNGNGTNAGVKLYLDGVRVDNADVFSGAYTAMEDLTADPVIGAIFSGGGWTNPVKGKVALPFIRAGELSADEVWALTQLEKGILGY